MTYFQAYLLTRLDYFHDFLVVLVLIGMALSGIGGICYALGGEEYDNEAIAAFRKKMYKPLKYMCLSVLFGGFISIFIPSTKEAAFIYIAPAIVNNVDVQKTLSQIPQLSNLGMEYLNETLKELVQEKKLDSMKSGPKKPETVKLKIQ